MIRLLFFVKNKNFLSHNKITTIFNRFEFSFKFVKKFIFFKFVRFFLFLKYCAYIEENKGGSLRCAQEENKQQENSVDT